MYNAACNGFQSALMAPTELLARQHYQTLASMMGADIQVALLTSSTPAAEKKEILQALAQGGISLLVGTHALLSEQVAFHRLALVITDEQTLRCGTAGGAGGKGTTRICRHERDLFPHAALMIMI
ncbi:MAG: DEAD/DEAH box helicase [Hydrogeniiclostridium mannosilyticum]